MAWFFDGNVFTVIVPKGNVESPAGPKGQTSDQTSARIDGTIRSLRFSGPAAARVTGKSVLLGTESSPRSVLSRTAGSLVTTPPRPSTREESGSNGFGGTIESLTVCRAHGAGMS